MRRESLEGYPQDWQQWVPLQKELGLEIVAKGLALHCLDCFMWIIKNKWLGNFEMMRLSIENDHKFSGDGKSKPETSRKMCVTNVIRQAGEGQTQEREGAHKGPGRRWWGSELGQWNGREGVELSEGSEEERAALASSLVADPSDRNTVVGREKSVSLDWSRSGWGDAGSSADGWNYKLDKRKCNQCPLEVIPIIHFICIVCHSFLCFQTHL